MKTFPKHYSFCPRCGGRLTIQARQKFDLCNRCGFELYDSIIAGTTLIIVNTKKEILLTKRARDPHRGMWGTPGGFVDRGETAEEAARREAREELDLRLHALEYRGTYPLTYRYQGVDYAYLEITFLARVKNPKPKARDDISAAKFFPIKKIPYARLAFQSQGYALKAFIKEELERFL